MIYVFDSSSLSVLSYFPPDNFPTLWNALGALVSENRILSVREVLNELRNRPRIHVPPFLELWVRKNRAVFQTPTEAEMSFVAEIFAIRHFQHMVGLRQRLQGTPVADPFVIAAAKVRSGCVVTEESAKPNSARMPDVCCHFAVPCTNFAGFMQKEGWRF